MLRLMKISMLAGGLVAAGVVVASGAGASPLTASGAGASAAAAVTSADQGLSTALLANRGAGAHRARGTVRATAPNVTSPVTGTALMTGTVPGANGFGHGGHGFGGRGGFGEAGGFGRGRGLTVTGVNGNTIAATDRGGQTVTVQVSATTAYTEAGASASLSDVKTGSIIAVRGSNDATGGTTITATGVTIVLPQVAGVVTGVSGSTFTLTGFNGTTRTVTVGDATRYQRGGSSAALTDIATGTAIVAEGTTASDGSLSAVRVTIQVPRVAGQVTAVNGASYTVAGRFGQTAYTIATTGSTTFVKADGSTTSASAVTTGVFIVAEGPLSSDGKTLTAQRVIVAPAGAGRGYGRHGGYGGRGFYPGSTGAGESDPSAPSTTGTASI